MELDSPKKVEEETAFDIADWTRYYDDNYHTYYYVHSPSGHTQWEIPTGPPQLTTNEHQAHHQLDEAPSVENIRLIKSSSFENPTKYTPWGLHPDHVYGNSSEEEDGNSLPRRTRSVSDDQGIKWIGSEDFLERGVRLMSMESILSDLNVQHNEYGEQLGLMSGGREDYDRDNIPLKREVIVYPGGKNQDYIGLAKIYKLQRPYSDPNYKAICLLCRSNIVEDAFFPCEHHCVCRACITKENICEEKQLRKNPKGYINCSLCASVIKLILPLDGGKEVDKYWNWVYDEKVELPKGFMKDFRHSAAVIQAVYIDDKDNDKEDKHGSTFCCIS